MSENRPKEKKSVVREPSLSQTDSEQQGCSFSDSLAPDHLTDAASTERKLSEITARLPCSAAPIDRNWQNIELLSNAKWRSLGPQVLHYLSDGLLADVSFQTNEKTRALEDRIRGLQAELDKKTDALKEVRSTAVQTAVLRSKIEIIEQERELILKEQNLRHLLDRVNAPAKQALLLEGDLRAKFEEDRQWPAFVMSIDIRRSTELMLKARTPKLFADFITELCVKLGVIIVDNFGVFDKFTGDGILAFFPQFFTGEDAAYRVVKAADECHQAFSRHYDDRRRCFTSVLRGTGLGIGIDYGDVQIVRVRGELTVVGTPVVYACRMGGADAGETLMNQPAYEQLFDKFSGWVRCDETSLPFKHEGEVVAYRVAKNEKQRECAAPEWLAACAQKNQPAD